MAGSSFRIRFSRASAPRRPHRRGFVPNLDVLESRLAPSATYYVSSAGNDANDGLSEASAWQTLNRVNIYRPRPGDTILLEGSQTFSGTLEVWLGDPGNPISIDSYGSGRATIFSGDASALMAGSPGGLHLRNLRLVGSGADNNSRNGLELANDGRGHASNFLLEDVEVTGYGLFGIYVWSDAYGLSGLTLCRVDTHHTANGAYIGHGLGRRITDVLLSEVRAYENDRLAPTVVSGFGVHLQGVSRAVIERSVFAYNGALGGPGPGDTGLYVLDASFVRVEHNEAYGNLDETWGDGHGICLGNVDDSVVQYNYAHDNRGYGLVLALDDDGTTYSHRNTVRYNVTQNNYAGVSLTGNVYDTEFYNNTIYAEPGPGGSFRVGVVFTNWTGANAHFRNNIFVTAGGSPQVLVDDDSMPSSPSIAFQNNAYYNLTAPSTIYIVIGGQGYYTLDQFRAGTGHELLYGVVPVGFQLDPHLLSPGGGWTIDDPWQLASLAAYQLDDASPLRHAGLDLLGVFGISPGSQDFYGGALPSGVGFSLGAYQAPLGDGPVSPPRAGDSSQPLADPLALLSILEESVLARYAEPLEQPSSPGAAPGPMNRRSEETRAGSVTALPDGDPPGGPLGGGRPLGQARPGDSPSASAAGIPSLTSPSYGLADLDGRRPGVNLAGERTLVASLV